MKLARREVTVEHEIVPNLCDRAAVLQTEIEAAFEQYIDYHMVSGVPRTAIVAQAVNEAQKLDGDRRNWFRILRLMTHCPCGCTNQRKDEPNG
jgi:CDP-glycerol glycerophosphotransferase (TagB/SpsB family)